MRLLDYEAFAEMSLVAITGNPSEPITNYILDIITEYFDEDELCYLAKYFSAKINNIEDVNVRVKMLEFIKNHRKGDEDASIGL